MANAATVGILRALLTADTAEFDSAMKRSASALKGWTNDMKSIGRQATQIGSALTKTLTLPLVGLGLGASKLATDFESSFAGVRKTVDATEPEFAAMAQSFRNLAKEIPVNVNELNRLGEAAGALGIPKAEIVDFARVMALLGTTTNLTADQAAESIAKIQNIFGAAGKDTDRFAATLVALGNDGASTETQIVEMATRIAGAGNAVGMSQGQVLAFASALSSVGLEAEAGGSAISRVFIEIGKSVSQGGKDLAGFAKTANMPVAEFARLFKEDAAAAMQAFISGLSNIKASGGDLIGTLTELGFTEVRVRDTLLRAAGAGDILTQALNLQKTAWQENSALTEEARKRFETTESQMTLLWNRIKDVGVTLGNALLPVINMAIDAMGALVPILEKVAGWFGSMPAPLQGAIVVFGGLLAAAGPVLLIFGQIASSIAVLLPYLPALGTAFSTLVAVMTGPIGWITAAAIGLSAVWLTWGDDITAVVTDAYTSIKTWLWDKLEPVLTPLIGLAQSIGEAFEAFGQLVGAVVGRIFGEVTERLNPLWEGISTTVATMYRTVKGWLDKIPTALLPLLGPIGLVVAAFRHWDEISRIAQVVYTAVKTWLLDKFTDIVAGIKGKIDAVTGFFRDMKDKVVGRSFVPEMMDGIKDQFLRLGDIMAKPALDAVATVTGHFRGMLSDVSTQLSDWGSTAEAYISEHVGGPIGKAFGAIWDVVTSVAMKAFDGLVSALINRFLKPALNAILGSQGAYGSAISSLFGGGAAAGGAAAGAGGAGGAGAAGAGAAGAGGSGMAGAIAGNLATLGLQYFVAQHGDLVTDPIGSFLFGFGHSEERQTGISQEEYDRRYGTPEGNYYGDNIPGMAEGGIVMPQHGGTLVRLAEAGYPEMVTPMKGGASVGSPMTIVVELDRRRFAEEMIEYIPGALKRFKLA